METVVITAIVITTIVITTYLIVISNTYIKINLSVVKLTNWRKQNLWLTK
jgi:hypothetical protein